MENRNLDKALDIVSKLITGENVSERGENAALYQEYNNNAEVYDIVHMSLKKLNLNIYEYNNGLYVSAGDNNRVFGYSNEELRNVLGLRVISCVFHNLQHNNRVLFRYNEFNLC